MLSFLYLLFNTWYYLLHYYTILLLLCKYICIYKYIQHLMWIYSKNYTTCNKRIFFSFLFSSLSLSCLSKHWMMSVTSWRSMKKTTTTHIALRSTTGMLGWKGMANPKQGKTPIRVRRLSISYQGQQATSKARQRQEPRTHVFKCTLIVQCYTGHHNIPSKGDLKLLQFVKYSLR